jgi:hypothetical protein
LSLPAFGTNTTNCTATLSGNAIGTVRLQLTRPARSIKPKSTRDRIVKNLAGKLHRGTILRYPLVQLKRIPKLQRNRTLKIGSDGRAAISTRPNV